MVGGHCIIKVMENLRKQLENYINNKEMILNVMNDQLSSKAPLEIYDILKNAGWNLENAIDKLIDNPETPGN